MRLEADEGFKSLRDATERQCRIADGAIFQLQRMRQLGLVEFA
jgi:hypothetical protein